MEIITSIESCALDLEYNRTKNETESIRKTCGIH